MAIAEAVLRRLTGVPGVLGLWARFPAGSVATRVRYGIFERPHYAYGMYKAAQQARALKLPAISAMEFGVSRGLGLLAMESAAREISEATGIRVSVFGFDTGGGLPPPEDYRDLPHVWQQGFYKMDAGKLQARLQGAELLLGDVADTVPEWLKRSDVPPVGFAAFDMDYYSSTIRAFRLFGGPTTHHLPRTYCYLDDITWPEEACHCDYLGELAALRDFNAVNEHRKICPLNLLRNTRANHSFWHDQMYVFHNFQHPRYNDCVLPQQAVAFESRSSDL
jgi:hypothetical protein